MSQTMKAVVFKGPHKVVIEDREYRFSGEMLYNTSLHEHS